ncbi:F-box/kelch-repeat protein At3g06240-like [Silene latifolia]|uniref:F-box/kelch-repeat protein At3g06240-like n=1 Tax=Silene latifolia TaxID=37657 RepID=UPI003D77EEC8
MAMLPTEILLDEILPKLPVKSLLRFKSVSKQFETLISSPNFILRHLRHSLSSATNRLLITSEKGRLQSSDLDSPDNPPVPLPLPDFFRPSYEISMIGFCNGLLLLGSGADFLLINPSTGFYSAIPGISGPVYYSRFGFGYDPVNDEYKIAAIDEHHIAVLNLSDKLWRIVDNSRADNVASVPDGRLYAAVYDNHLCHWLNWCELRNRHRIVCFDLLIENWTRDIPLPNYNDNDDNSGDNSDTSQNFADLLFDECRDKRNDVTALHVLNGFLSVLTRNNDDNSADGYDVWVMKEYGIKESWIKLLGFSDTRCTPLAFGGGSSSKVLCKTGSPGRNRLKWYIVRQKQYKNAEIHDVHGVKRLYDVCVVNGSLVSVPGGKRIRGNTQGGNRRW